jgi:hypothetical protein
MPFKHWLLCLLTSNTGLKAEYRYCSRWWTTADIERPVVRHYQIPTASYRDAVWPNLNQPRHDLPCFWVGSYRLIGTLYQYCHCRT